MIRSWGAILGWLGTAGVLVAGGEWMRAPSPWLALVVVAAALAGLLESGPRRGLVLARRGLGLSLALVVAATQLGLIRIDRAWPAVRRSRLAGARAELVRALDGQVGRLQALAAKVGSLPAESRERAFARLERMLPRAAPEVALALLDRRGAPVIWAGPQRIRPSAAGDAIAVRVTAFYASLEVRRQSPSGELAVASALLRADPAAPGEARSLARAVEARYGVTVDFRPTATPAVGTEWPAAAPIMGMTVDPGGPGASATHLLARADPVIAWLVILLGLAGAFSGAHPAARVGSLGLLVWVTLRAPIGETLGLSQVFSPSAYFSRVLGPFSASAGALAVTGLVGLLGAIWLARQRLPRTWPLAGLGLLLVLGTPLVVRALAAGITPPSRGVSLGLWWIWQVSLLLTTAALLLAAATFLRAGLRPSPHWWPALLAGGAALAVAGVGVAVFPGGSGWPDWYPWLWLPVLLAAGWPGRRGASLIAIAIAASAGAALLTWSATLSGRAHVAVRDLDGLGSVPDPLTEPLLTEFAADLVSRPLPAGPTALYQRWLGSGLARQGYPVRLSSWPPDLPEGGGEEPQADVVVDALAVPDSVLRRLARSTEMAGLPTVRRFVTAPGVHYLLAVRLDDRRVVTVATGPRTALVTPAPLGRLLVTGPERTPLYKLSLAPRPVGPPPGGADRWVREGTILRSWRPVRFADGTREVHALIALGKPSWLFVRASLVVVLDMILLGTFWLLAGVAFGGVVPRVDWRGLARSYQARLALALAVFFTVPAALLVGLSLSQLSGEARRTQDLVLQRVLRDAAPESGYPAEPGAAKTVLAAQRDRVNSDLALYHGGRLVGSSEPVLEDLGVFPPVLDSWAYHAIHLDGDQVAAQPSGWPATPPVRLSYAATAIGQELGPGVLVTVESASDRVLTERIQDLAYLLLLATLLGVLAALAGARLAAGALARPVRDLRTAALAFGSGRDPDLPRRLPPPPPEFEPVFEAFGRMAADVRAGQAALEAARRRTDAVLATVATGVIAVDGDRRVLLANRRATEALGRPLEAGRTVEEAMVGPWARLGAEVARRLETAPGGRGEDETDFDVEAGDRRYTVQSAPLGRGPDGGGGGGGLVLAIHDVTEATRAARVLAWAEVAGQVAHAIKNPLTPVRLGVQHLRRIRVTHPDRLDRTVEETGVRILAEIERLDAIARAFSRFAAPTEPALPFEEVEVEAVVREVTALYAMSPELAVTVALPPGTGWRARRDELKEVLFNLFENARNAGARRITVRGTGAYIEVADNGRGIPAALIGRVFEPRFSTTSSGSGLGLAIVRRLVEGWGGHVALASVEGRGTTVTLHRAPDPKR